MDCRRPIVRYAVSLCAAVALMSSVSAGDGHLENLQLDPDRIEVGIFYHGAEVQVTADVQSCDGVVLVLEAGTEETTFNRKGRRAGIWLSLAQVTISGVPKVYLMGASKALEDICSGQTQRELGLGIASLRDRIEIESEEPLMGGEAEQFLSLKTEAGTYSTDIPISLIPGTGNKDELSARLSIPATAPPGEYSVTLYCFADGQLVDKATSGLNIHRVGLANLLASLAYERAALYGVVAILIAMMVGVFMGMVFHSRPGSGH